MVCGDAPEAPGVEVLGRLTDDELADRYRRAWTFCLPSSYEGFGIPYAEAMAAGCPVVATPNPGAAEVLDGGRLGALVADDELGAALVGLLGDADRRERVSVEGVAAAGRFGWDAVLGRYAEVYDEVVATKGRT
jgi:glycosyltransferase involved in cell wall biosynthesis